MRCCMRAGARPCCFTPTPRGRQPLPSCRRQTAWAVGVGVVVRDAWFLNSLHLVHRPPARPPPPRFSLRDMPASGYRIRKAHAPDQLSTLEASAHALGQVEGDAARFRPLFDAFEGFVDQQAAFVPRLKSRE
jgi:DTW domain-containing protein YfiP